MLYILQMLNLASLWYTTIHSVKGRGSVIFALDFSIATIIKSDNFSFKYKYKMTCESMVSFPTKPLVLPKAMVRVLTPVQGAGGGLWIKHVRCSQSTARPYARPVHTALDLLAKLVFSST